jgi:hypothetical protein
MTIFTAGKRRALERISGNYLNLMSEEDDFTLSDVFSLGILLTHETTKADRNQNTIEFYKSAYSILCGALKISNPEIFLVRLATMSSSQTWDDFSDFKAVWYPKWFENQVHLRLNLFCFSNEEEHKIKPDFWGATSSEEALKKNMLEVRDSFKQIRVGALALVYKIDKALISLLGWQNFEESISWKLLKEKYMFPTYRSIACNN